MKPLSYLVRICMIFFSAGKNEGKRLSSKIKQMGCVDVWEK